MRFIPIYGIVGIVIRSFKDKTTRDIFDGISTKSARKLPPHLHQRARDLLDVLNAVTRLETLRVPPSNRFHALKKDLVGFYSVSINDQWRIIFRWNSGGAEDVQITDYH